MNMVIDAGNTFTKVGIFEKESLKKKEVFRADSELQSFLQKFQVENALISSVAGNENEIASWSRAGHTIVLSHDTPLPIQNHYAASVSLGVDRIAAACGAWLLFTHQNSLVIDVGTCINYEFISKEGAYFGGAISPGVRMRFESMHQFTEKLPVATAVSNAPLTGNDTSSCLQSGVMNGMLEEIKGIILRYTNQYPGVRVILCGGDAHFFENHLKPSIFVAPELVLLGLNSILLHNVTS
jgi:type III pantothenate kinase